MEQGFEIAPDGTNMRLRVRGKTIEDLFRFAVKGVATILKPGFEKLRERGGAVRHSISIRAVDLSSLLAEFISEVIAKSDIKNIVFSDVIFKEFGENFLSGEIAGVAVDGFDSEIRAVSYQDVDIKKNLETGMYETTLVFEV